MLDQFLHIDNGSIHLAQAQLQRAQAFIATGNEDEAINAFRSGLDAERKRPNVRTEAWLLFPWFIVETQNTGLYGEAISVLDEFTTTDSLALPVSLYRFHCIMAILLDHEGDDAAQATVYAQRALAASKTQHSGYRYHPHLGLVQETNTTVHERVCQIAARDTT